MNTVDVRPALAKRLIQQQAVDATTVDAIVAEARRSGCTLVRQLLDSGALPSAVIADTASSVFGIERAAAASLDPDPEVMEQIDTDLILRLNALPLRISEGLLRIAVSDPANTTALDELRFHTGLPVVPVIADEADLHARIAVLTEGGVGAAADELASASRAEEVRDTSSADPPDDTPVIRYINELLRRAIREEVSDIHLEPFETHCRVRFRHDGILHEAARPPRDMADRLAARLKIMARMDIAERRLPQDGRLRLGSGAGDGVDFRVSSLPTLFGEKLVLRLLDPAATTLDLDSLGMEADQLAAYRAAIERPHGMILVTGPTGSGKTVTLYSALQQLNQSSRNILTVEDPVEIKLPGINQIAVNHRIGLDFPSLLRAFLRQDPDVMMVGEIRDRETAEIAIKAAQTGHLVLSTLHTNTAAGAITRLINMGIPRWSIAASVILISAQRLIRRLCPHCRRPAGSASDEGGWFEADGCQRCHHGYRGRVGIHEVLPMTDSLGRRILRADDDAAIATETAFSGLRTLRDTGMAKAARGLTSRSEIDRVTRS
ncbi:GspE/PulE family protein [Spiribacter vilamensis]|uniref:Type IV pilus assembly protein PilB n=1 Tax=Spiribacter vilamensis TaxID=531306 RepID=A0A4Q8CY81_9GAMM|nr:ATPase, T2SS/T4P/T4SS family [Spiribacter vilamensis]RZU97928.1 type IV pilus assembly protein PilB [Spiribacter vilamensis]TVO61159.1 type IV-A pilus assembly ATPase PilB [Spiribacter vilamensis]